MLATIVILVLLASVAGGWAPSVLAAGLVPDVPADALAGAAGATGLFGLSEAQAGAQGTLDALVFFCATCVLTGAIEELIFRGALMRGAVHFGCTWQRAAFISAVVFGLMHLGLPAEDLTTNACAWTQCVLKVLEGVAFGYALATLYASLKKLWPCMLLHITFDALYFAPYFHQYRAFPTTYVSGNAFDLAGLFCSCVLLAAAALVAWVSWRKA